MASKAFVLATAFTVTAFTAFAQSRLELAQQYKSLSAVQEMMTAMFSPDASAVQLRASLPPGFPITDDQALRAGEVTSGVLMDRKPKIEALQVEAIDEVFTEEEINAMMEFHSSEVGAQILIRTQPMFQRGKSELTPQIVQAMADKQPEIQQILSE